MSIHYTTKICILGLKKNDNSVTSTFCVSVLLSSRLNSLISMSVVVWILPFIQRALKSYGIVTPDRKVHEARMGPTWGRQDPGGPHLGHVSLTVWDMFCRSKCSGKCNQNVRYHVVAGDNRRNGADDHRQRRRVKFCLCHPDYKPGRWDIAVIVLKDKLNLNFAVKPIVFSNKKMTAFRKCKSTGWGLRKWRAYYSKIYQVVGSHPHNQFYWGFWAHNSNIESRVAYILKMMIIKSSHNTAHEVTIQLSWHVSILVWSDNYINSGTKLFSHEFN